ncbi:MAG: formylmethanofuran dehydrogenase subunit C [Planctomycetota bacterium]
MSHLGLHLRSEATWRTDVSLLRTANLFEMASERDVLQTVVNREHAQLGDLFELTSFHADAVERTLVIEGDLSHIDGIGTEHAAGTVIVHGNVGHRLGACMSGGRILVHGDAGDHVGGCYQSRGVGMRGGIIEVAGDVGSKAGCRMRRGQLWIGGNAGDGLAALQVAGSIVVAGEALGTLGTGMRRGTVLLGQAIDLANGMSQGFTTEPFRQVFAASLGRWCQTATMQSLTKRLSRENFLGFRCDVRVGGQGEIWMPAGSAS